MNILESFYSNIKNNLSVESFNGYKYDLKCLIRFLCEREGTVSYTHLHRQDI